ncbi:hypothetical protein H2198_008345 [Neophaeococcomyces mojaviensis]|uniref:Uncharacterized protein n=1 Tax=Neophaeococcomyces mojaviensis TaxID=3383035 RepID=A0ACC2ZXG4_9EURO|nr:hypothetical protein H2198_008345 [Knufia sp. JES_112]
MPICINCSYPLPHLYTTYSKADDRSLGKGVRLTQCSNCKRFADKYVEHDYVVLFIDLVLIKPQVYRHLLFNRLSTGTGNAGEKSGEQDRLDPSILRLGILLVLFDVYITWARIEKGSGEGIGDGKDEEGASVLTTWPIVGQYLFFLTLNLLSTVAQHVTIRGLARSFPTSSPDRDVFYGSLTPTALGQGHSRTSSVATERPRDRDTSVATSPSVLRKVSSHSPHRSPQPVLWRGSHQHQYDTSSTGADTPIATPTQASGSAISTALLVSSCTKLFPILLVIWPTTASSDNTSSATAAGPFASRAASYIGWVVLFNNIEALMILLQPQSGYVGVTALAVAGFAARFAVEGWLLSVVGLARDASGPVGDFLSIVSWIREGMGIR